MRGEAGAEDENALASLEAVLANLENACRIWKKTVANLEKSGLD